MKSKILQTVAGCFIGTVFIGAFTYTVQASNLGTEVPSAGMAVALESYYAKQEDPKTEILACLTPLVASPEDENMAIYNTLAISQVDDYVNVRTEPSIESEVVGKIFNNCAATIVGQDGDWYQIESGNVKGYINKEFVVTGEEAQKLALKVGYVIATVTTETLNVREGQSTDTELLTQIPEGEVCDVQKYGDGWVYLNIDNDVKGWVSEEFVKIDVDYKTAITLEEEQEQIRKEEEAKRKAEEAEEAARKAREEEEAARQAEEESRQAEAERQAQEATQEPATQDYSEPEETYDDAVDTSSKKATREAVVAYAQQFLGNPYVYGGTSLTNGTDCSGFTMSVYAHFGYALNRASYEQVNNGISVSMDSLLPGDLLFYTNGGSSIGHVALYIGDGQIIHASTERTGIIIGNAFYRTPCAARRIIN